jgi:hypothetical protein
MKSLAKPWEAEVKEQDRRDKTASSTDKEP